VCFRRLTDYEFPLGNTSGYGGSGAGYGGSGGYAAQGQGSKPSSLSLWKTFAETFPAGGYGGQGDYGISMASNKY
jgi:hypothetical protein